MRQCVLINLIIMPQTTTHLNVLHLLVFALCSQLCGPDGKHRSEVLPAVLELDRDLCDVAEFIANLPIISVYLQLLHNLHHNQLDIQSTTSTDALVRTYMTLAGQQHAEARRVRCGQAVSASHCRLLP